MGFRFRKSKKVGLFRINMSQKGIGWSVGVKGLRYTKKADGASDDSASSSRPTASSGPESSMTAASSEVQEEEGLPAESTPASEPAAAPAQALDLTPCKKCYL